MNIHPLIVHFPIAFLSVYSLFELVRFRYITSTAYWFYIKASLVLIGTAGAAAAYLSGELAEELVGESSLIELHSRWAKLSCVLFGLIAVVYALAWFSRLELVGRIEKFFHLDTFGPYALLKRIVNYFAGSPIMMLPALAGLVSITVTGALGAVMVYGQDIDPFVSFIYGFVK